MMATAGAAAAPVEELKSLLAQIKTLSEGNTGEIKTLKEANEKLLKDFDEAKKQLDALRKAQLVKRESQITRSGNVSDDCARYLAAVALSARLRSGKDTPGRDAMEGIVKEILGVEAKAALTSSDIPLPTEFSGQVVELVSMYGAARRHGTVFPLGSGTVKLPKLSTDPTFGLIASSASITEKSPQVAWVTFNPEKFGGLIRLPSELDADSIVPIGQFVARYSARQIARVEDHNFFVGTGAGSGVNGAVKGLTYSTIDNSKVTQMAATKTKFSDATLANFRTLRSVVDSAALKSSKYYLHPSFEQLLATFNTAGDKPYNPQAQIAGTGANPFTVGPTLDGFAIEWVDSMPAYSTSANVSTVFALFGDCTYQYLGTRGGLRYDTSADAAFATDEILIRALERFTIGLMANGAVAGLETAAA